jgi:glycosyltransferase involved in cell wall biosynthesis
MVLAPRADVIVSLEESLWTVLKCLESVLEYACPTLLRLFVVSDRPLNPDESAELARLASSDSRVEFILSFDHEGFVGLYNRGLTESGGDAVLLRGDCIVTRDWLAELSAVTHSEERTACTSPLINDGGSSSVPELFAATPGARVDDALVRRACAGLPRWTVAPSLTASCIYLRGDVIGAVGLLDAGLTCPGAAVNNWVLRAQSLGFAAKRSNHTYVHRPGIGDDGRKPGRRSTASTSDGEHGQHVVRQNANFCASLDGHLAAHAVQLESTGKLRVALDLRHLPREQTGTRTYAVCLGQALGSLPDLELTLLVRDRAAAAGLSGRVVMSEQWQDDVQVIHKPAQVVETSELQLLFGSSAHLVVTYQDLIGYQIPLVFPDDTGFDRYRSTSSLTLPAVQRVIAYSDNAGAEIAAEFGIPRSDVAIVPLGVDARWFARSEPRDEVTHRKLRLPARYFFSLATDFPHKNLPNLLDAYAILRSRWRHGEPPGLVLAGYRNGGRSGVYPGLASKPLVKGLVFLGPVSADELRVLYQRAVALVFPSLYEGFGLPPLESMAAGTPVIAMPISAIPEVAGDCVLYPDGLSADSLARSMELLATDDVLHEALRMRGLQRVEDFRWETTARATLEVYRAAVRRPSERSLQMRRLLRDAIFRWAQRPAPTAGSGPAAGAGATSLIDDATHEQSIGVKNAWRALNFAIGARLKREMRRLPLAANSKATTSPVSARAREQSLVAEKTI